MSLFDKAWYDEIAEVTSSEEYQKATLRIEDPSLITADYDVVTGETEYEGDPVVFHGQGRLIGVRWGVFSGGESQANSTTLSPVRIQIPQHAMPRVKVGCFVYIEEAPNMALTSLVFKVRSDLQGSSAASRTFECEVDMDSEAYNG